MAQKVYVIKPSKTDNRPGPGTAAGKNVAAAKTRIAAQTTLTPGERWARILLAYLAGPLTLVLWSHGRLRYYWAGLGLVSVAAVAYMLVDRSTVANLTGITHNGVFVWIALLSAATVCAAAVWAGAVSLTGRDSPPLGSVSSDAVHHPVTVCLLGLLLPGLGYLLKGHARRAAGVLVTMGLMALALVVLVNWRLLWDGGRWSVPSGPSGLSLEIVFVAAAAVAAVSAFIWIVQALDGGRRFSARRGPAAHADLISLALLVVLVVFVTTVRPVPLAQSLAATAGGLHDNGFRLIPLGLYEAAARMDPACPTHLAHAALVNEQLGMADAARAKRYTLQHRMEQYERVVWGNTGPDRLTRGFMSVAGQPLPGFEWGPEGDIVRRIHGPLRPETSP